MSTIEYGEEERHRIAAIHALAWVAGSDLLPQQVIPQIVVALRDEQRSDLERSRLAHILGLLPNENITPNVVDILQHLVHIGPSQTSASALEALTHNGRLLEMPDLLEKNLGLSAEGNQWNYHDATGANQWIARMIGVLYGHDTHSFAPAVAALLEHARLFEIITLLGTLEEVHHVRHQPIPSEVRTALLTRLAQLQDAMLITPTQLLQTCAYLIPDQLAEQTWESEWDTWTPETRVSLAEALGQGKYTSKVAWMQATSHLLQLLRDAQYAVRRSACRSLSSIAHDILFHVCITWTYTPIMELKRRAAEILSWLPTEQESRRTEVSRLHQRLVSDQDSLVREAANGSITECRQRIWSSEYLAQIRSVYGKDAQAQLAAWRYGHALTHIGDEVTLAELKKDLAIPQLSSHECQWLRWIFSNAQEQWKKTMDQWPKPWFTLAGEVIYDQAHVILASHQMLQGICSLYQRDDTSSNSQTAHWRGVFWFNTPTVVPKRKVLTFHLASGRLGQAIVVESINNEMWLLQGKGRLTH